MSKVWEIEVAEALVADLYMNQGLGGQEQFRAEAYRRRLVSQMAGILGECKDARVAEMEGALEGAWPSEADLDWLMTAFQREHPDPDIWLRQHAEDLGARAIAKVIVSVWEAGRLKTEKVQKTLAKGGG